MVEKTIHQGRNIKRFREMMGMKQEALAITLGDDWNQKKISQLESKKVIDVNILEQVAKALRIPRETLENMDVEDAIFNIQNNYDNSHSNTGPINELGTLNINAAGEWLKALEENKGLYERLLQSEREKVEMLERLLKEK